MLTTDERLTRLEARVRKLVQAGRKTKADKTLEKFKTLGIWVLIATVAFAVLTSQDAKDRAGDALTDVEKSYKVVGETESEAKDLTDRINRDSELLKVLDPYKASDVETKIKALYDPKFEAALLDYNLKGRLEKVETSLADEERVAICWHTGVKLFSGDKSARAMDLGTDGRPQILPNSNSQNQTWIIEAAKP